MTRYRIHWKTSEGERRYAFRATLSSAAKFAARLYASKTTAGNRHITITQEKPIPHRIHGYSLARITARWVKDSDSAPRLVEMAP